MITDQQLFTSPRSKPARQLAELRARRRELQRRQRETTLDLDRAEREHDALTNEVHQAEARALAHGDDTDLKSQRSRLTRLEKDIDTHHAQAHTIDLAISTLAEEMTTLVRDNHAELIDEAAAGHEQARDRITHAIAGLVSMDAVRGWPSRVASVAG